MLAVFFLFPLVFMFVSSLKPDGQILSDIGSLRAFLPVGDISFDNYFGVFDRVPVGAVPAQLDPRHRADRRRSGWSSTRMAGFAISRLRWRGAAWCSSIIIATLIVPFETIAVPMVYWVAQLPTLVFEGGLLKYDFGWLDTYQVQIIPFIANAFSIFLFRQYFSTIPTVARRSGAHRWRGLVHDLPHASSCRCRDRRSPPSRS